MFKHKQFIASPGMGSLSQLYTKSDSTAICLILSLIIQIQQFHLPLEPRHPIQQQHLAVPGVPTTDGWDQ